MPAAAVERPAPQPAIEDPAGVERLRRAVAELAAGCDDELVKDWLERIASDRGE